MQIHSPTRIIATPFLMALVYIFYKSAVSYEFRDQYSWWIFPLLILCVAFYIFSPQIDFWFHKRSPLDLDEPVIQWLDQQFPFYTGLSEDNKLKFRNRLSLFLEAKDFSLIKAEKGQMPEDMKFIIAAHAIWLTLGRDDFLFDKYDRIIAYMHPFPTPYYKHLHTVESEIVDGVILFAFEYLLKGLASNGEYNIGLHGFAEAYIESNPDLSFPEISMEDQSTLEKISGIDTQRICDTIGFERVDMTLVSIHHYFLFPDQFAKFLPEKFKTLDSIFSMSKIKNRPIA